VNALDFDPWATLKRNSKGAAPPNPANPSNPDGAPEAGLGGLDALGGGACPDRSFAGAFALPSASPEQAADEAADRDAIAAERLLPDHGTPKRDGLDRRQAAMIAGSLAVSRRTP
jgi:hypothetical protein